MGCLSRGIEGTFSKMISISCLVSAVLEKSLKNHLKMMIFRKVSLKRVFGTFLLNSWNKTGNKHHFWKSTLNTSGLTPHKGMICWLGDFSWKLCFRSKVLYWTITNNKGSKHEHSSLWSIFTYPTPTVKAVSVMFYNCVLQCER